VTFNLNRSYSCVKRDNGFERLFQLLMPIGPGAKLKNRSAALISDWLSGGFSVLSRISDTIAIHPCRWPLVYTQSHSLWELDDQTEHPIEQTETVTQADRTTSVYYAVDFTVLPTVEVTI
jgi:hypothetical protein